MRKFCFVIFDPFVSLINKLLESFANKKIPKSSNLTPLSDFQHDG